jgi:hypothetical protein
MTVAAVRLGFALGAIPTAGNQSLPYFFLPQLFSSPLFSAMLLTSYLMYRYSFGKVVEGCIQFFAGGLIFAIGATYLLSPFCPHLFSFSGS